MGPFYDYLSQNAYAPASAPTLPQTKQSKVLEKSEIKKTKLGGPNIQQAMYDLAQAQDTNRAYKVTDEISQDLRNLSSYEFDRKYGDAAATIRSEQALGERQYIDDVSTTRTWGEAVGDTVTDVGLGFANSLGGLAALGTGMVSDEGGAAVSRFLDQANRDIRGATQSDALKARQRANASGRSLDAAYNEKLYQEDIANGESDFVASLNRIGRGVLDGLKSGTEDSMIFGSEASQALGSVFAAGPIAKGLNAAGNAAVKAGVARGVISPFNTVVPKVMDVAGKNSVAASIGLMEGGGAYQQAVNQVMEMSHEDLLTGSDEYAAFIRQNGDTPENREAARLQVAGSAGRTAAAIAAPLGMAAGKLVDRIEASPAAILMSGGLARNMLKEAAEESAQGASGQFAVNTGVAAYGDESLALADGVGESSAAGLLHGASSIGILQAPGAAVRGVANAGGAVVDVGRKGVDMAAAATKPARDAVMAWADKRVAAVEEKSINSETNVRAGIDEALGSVDELEANFRQAIDETNAAPEQRERAQSNLTKLLDLVRFDDTQLDADTHETVRQTLTGSTDQFDAMSRLVNQIENSPEGSEAQMAATIELYKRVVEHNETRNLLDTTISEVGDKHPSTQMLRAFLKKANRVTETPRVRAKLQDISQRIQAATNGGELSNIDEAEIATPQGQQKARLVADAATFAPADTNADLNDRILYHAERGDISLTEAQRRALRVSSYLVRQKEARQKLIQERGLQTRADIVFDEIFTRKASASEEKYLSANDQIQRILEADRRGDREAVAAQLNALRRFAQHMQNKLAAHNESFERGDGSNVSFFGLDGNSRTMRDNVGSVYTNRKNAQSIRTAQTVAADANLLGRVANELSAAYADLGFEPLQLTELDPRMQGDADTIAKANREGTQENQQSAAEPVVDQKVEEQAQEQAEPVAEPAAEVEPEATTEPTSEPAAEPVTEPEAAAEADTTVPAETGQPEGGDTSTDAESSTESVESTPAPAQIEEAAEQATEQAAEEEPEVEKIQPVKSIEEMFPNLVLKSKLATGFKFPKEPKTRTFGVGKIFDFIANIITSKARVTELAGKKVGDRFDIDLAKAYYAQLQRAQSVREQLDRQLAAQLTKPLGNSTFGEVLVDPNGRMLTNFVNGRALSLVEEVDGKLQYNDELIEGAVLAAMEWLINADDRIESRDLENVASITGLPESEIRDGLIQEFKEGYTTLEVKQALARKIAQFWGLEFDNSAPLADNQGILEGVAAEILKAFEALKMVETYDLRFDVLIVSDVVEDGKSAKTVRTPKLFKPVKLDPLDPVLSYPNAFELMVRTTPEMTNYIGDAPTEIDTRQLRNGEAVLTKEQIAALETEQKQPFYTNTVMLDFMLNTGKEAMQALFGGGPIKDEKLFHPEHLKSLKGQNTTIGSAYDSIVQLAMDLRGRAEVDGVEVQDLPIFYRYTFNSMNRMQMLGQNNPQASKLMREVVLPTWSTLDLEGNANHLSAFALAIGQAIGIKVHTMPRADVIAKVSEAMTGKLSGSVKALRGWLRDQSQPLSQETINTLKSELGDDISPVAVHALVEYARLMNSSREDRAEFRTSLYVEADGVTNGPSNAMVLLSTAEFTGDNIRHIRKGGLFIGHDAMTMNEHRGVDSKDFYETASDKLSSKLGQTKSDLKKSPEMVKQFNQMIQLMLEFSPDVIQNDETKKVDFKRGLTKNPLTIILYGSGAQGMASNLANDILDAVYERMSRAKQLQKARPGLSMAEAMFPDAADPKRQMIQFLRALDNLTSSQIVKSKKGFIFGPKPAPASGKISPTGFNLDYVLTNAEFDNLRTNIQHMFVAPLQDAIRETVGLDVMSSAEKLRSAIQLQSVALQEAFRQEVDAALEEKAKDPNWFPSQFLSPNELREIMQKLKKLYPAFNNSMQNYFIAKDRDLLPDTVRSLGSALDSTKATKPQIKGPADAGVKGMPSTIIGYGDGLMMLLLSTMPGAPEKTLKIFDGMHLALDGLDDGAKAANQAVFESWMGNPLMDISTSFKAFVGNLEASPYFNDEMKLELAKVLGTTDIIDDNGVPTAVIEQLESFGKDLEDKANWVEARHWAMRQLNLSVDQMASVGTPYSLPAGETAVEWSTEEDLAKALNRLTAEKYRELVGKSKPRTTKPKTDTQKAREEVRKKLEADLKARQESTDISADLEAATKPLESGARMITMNKLRRMLSKMRIPARNMEMLRDILRSKAADDYQIIYGTQEQIQAYADEAGIRLAEDEADIGMIVNGFIMPGEKKIFLVNPSSQTLVHELIHAATYMTLVRHYNQGDLEPEKAQAIARLEQLMEEFRNFDTSGFSFEELKGFFDAEAEVTHFLKMGNMPAALNEFMAWALANEQIYKVMQKDTNKPKSGLARLSAAAVKLIKKLVWGRKKAPEVGDDFYSNLRFNTVLLMQAAPSAKAQFGETTLYHAESYGRSDHLDRVNQTLSTHLLNWLLESVDPRVESLDIRRDMADKELEALTMSLTVDTNRIFAAFPMTMQERTTFETMQIVMNSAVQLDPNALARAQELFTHVQKELAVEDFMDDPMSQDPNDLARASEKYDVAMGLIRRGRDAQGRSPILPVFMALALTSEDFRKVLGNMSLPAKEEGRAEDLDGLLTKSATAVMTGLARRLGGIEKGETNVLKIQDMILARILKTAEERKSFMTEYVRPAGRVIDAANDRIVEAKDRAAEKLANKAEQIKQNSNNKFVKTAASAAKGVAGMVNQEIGEQVADEIMERLNRTRGFEPVFQFFNDLAGRTMSNAAVYDMIKKVRNWVQQRRQQYREELPGILAGKFSRELTKFEWKYLAQSLGKTDITALMDSMHIDDMLRLIAKPNDVRRKIVEIEDALSAEYGANWTHLNRKAKQLANYMNTGQHGDNLLRNAWAVANLWNEPTTAGLPQVTPGIERNVDALISLYALQNQPQHVLESLRDMIENEREGLKFLIAFQYGQRKDEMAKAMQGAARDNHYKGHLPTEPSAGVSLVVAKDSQGAELLTRSYIRVADYDGSPHESGFESRGYYFAPVAARAGFRQGIMQNIHQTASGVDLMTGFTNSLTAGIIGDPVEVEMIARRSRRRNAQVNENLLPVFRDGEIVAYERGVDPAQLELLKPEMNYAKILGMWRGRQVEEAEAAHVNQPLVDRLYEMWQSDINKSSDNEKQYINVLDPAEWQKDPVLGDAVRLLTPQTMDYIAEKFGGPFWVRRDMLEDTLGSRNASITDAFTGTSRWNPKLLEGTRKILLAIGGPKAYKYLFNAEKLLQEVVVDAKTTIVVRSVIVPMANVTANVLQLWARGVPIDTIVKGMLKKTSELNDYIKSRSRLDEAEAELRAAEAAGDYRKINNLRIEIRTIKDNHRRMSIWPLIEAGEFSSISDGAVTFEDMQVGNGLLSEYFEKLVDKLPPTAIALGRQGLITRDTALFQGLQRAIEYGDFLGKAVLYEHLTAKKKLTSQDALARVTEEFVNYDRSPGRFRGYLENIGALWFYNFKIRSTKIALSMIRNNPLHVIMAMTVPQPPIIGSVGSTISDNIFAIGANGGLDWSIGPGMGLNSMALNPWVNVVDSAM